MDGIVDMWDLLKNLAKKSKPVKEKPKTPRKPRAKKANAEAKVEAAEPKVSVINVGFDKNNPRVGDLELEWNAEFIALLSKHGYQGNTDEDKVDAWLNDICRTILSNNPPDIGLANLEGNNRYISRTNLGDGKTEVK
jgi:hypothetical protein